MSCTLGFNRSLRIEVRSERITGDAGAVTGREVLRRSGVVRCMAKRIRDARDGRRIRHTMTELLRTALLLAAQCRRDHNDAGALHADPALRLGGERPGRGRHLWGGRWRHSPRCRGWWRRWGRGRTPGCFATGLRGSRGGGSGS